MTFIPLLYHSSIMQRQRVRQEREPLDNKNTGEQTSWPKNRWVWLKKENRVTPNINHKELLVSFFHESHFNSTY